MINIITTDEQKNLYIDGSNCITVKNGSSVLGITCIYRPLLYAEFLKILEERKWNIDERPIIFYSIRGGDIDRDSATLYYLNQEKIDGTEPENGVFNVQGPEDYYRISDRVLSEEDKAELERIYEEIKGEEIPQKSDINLKMQSVSDNIIDRDRYINTFNVENIEKLDQSFIYKLDLTLEYTKKTDSGVIVCIEDFVFSPVYKKVYIDEKGIKREMWVSNNFSTILGNGDIALEHIDGIIRVVPNVDNLIECILSDCVITYGSNEVQKN